MKKSFKKTALVFLVLVMVASVVFSAVSCNKNNDGTTANNPAIPGIGTSGTTLAPQGSTGSSQSTADTSTTGGTTGTTLAPVIPPQNSGDYINPLTGLKTTYDASGKKPIAVVVDNISSAYAHQTGLTQADIMYETLVTPGITRLTLLISDYSSLSPICNIRNATLEHLDIVGSHNAMLVAHGGSQYNNFASVAAARLGGGWSETLNKELFGYINTVVDVGFTAEGGAKYGTIKYYSKTHADFVTGTLENGLKAKYYTDGVERADLGGAKGYDTILTTEGLMAVLSSKYSYFNLANSSKEGNAKSFSFASGKKVINGAAATNVSLTFTVDNVKGAGKKSVAYAYDAASGMYKRSQDGKAHKDAATGAQLAFTNVIALFTDVTSSEVKSEGYVASTAVVGEGTGYYFHGGEALEITWSKSAWDSELILKDKAGNKLELACGTTYVGYLDNTDTATAVSFN